MFLTYNIMFHAYAIVQVNDVWCFIHNFYTREIDKNS